MIPPRYRTHFNEKRRDQVKTAEDIIEHTAYEFRYKLLRAAIDEIFRQLHKSRKGWMDTVMRNASAKRLHQCATLIDARRTTETGLITKAINSLHIKQKVKMKIQIKVQKKLFTKSLIKVNLNFYIGRGGVIGGVFLEHLYNY